MLPDALDKVATLLSRFPGVGRRTAQRWAFFLLTEPESFSEELETSLRQLREHVHFCERCYHLSQESLCKICRDPLRDAQLLCIVENIPDLMAIERTHAFDGHYHVLHGALAPLKGIGPDKLHLDSLESRIEDAAIREIIVATSAGVEGEATALYLARRLAHTGVTLSRIAMGIPVGGELEYLDDHTLSRAITGRLPLG